jgi:hypothetical protein
LLMWLKNKCIGRSQQFLACSFHHELAHFVSFFSFGSNHLQLVILGRMRSFQWANIAEVAELSCFFNYFAIYFLISIQIKAVTELSTSLRRASIEDVNCCEGPSELFFFIFTQILGQIGTSENLLKSIKSYCSWSFFLRIAYNRVFWRWRNNIRKREIFLLSNLSNSFSLTFDFILILSCRSMNEDNP